METKPPWLSKTVWVSLVVAIVPFFPGVAKIIGDNPEAVGVTLGAVFLVLRLVTKDKIVID